MGEEEASLTGRYQLSFSLVPESALASCPIPQQNQYPKAPMKFLSGQYITSPRP